MFFLIEIRSHTDRKFDDAGRILPAFDYILFFLHTFSMVDFAKKAAYDLFLGRPFKRQSKLSQDWGSNDLYLRHANAMTRVSTIDHFYKDVKEKIGRAHV